jgi:hypothetical protein
LNKSQSQAVGKIPRNQPALYELLVDIGYHVEIQGGISIGELQGSQGRVFSAVEKGYIFDDLLANG